jgi:hypothetical protein
MKNDFQDFATKIDPNGIYMLSSQAQNSWWLLKLNKIGQVADYISFYLLSRNNDARFPVGAFTMSYEIDGLVMKLPRIGGEIIFEIGVEGKMPPITNFSGMTFDKTIIVQPNSPLVLKNYSGISMTNFKDAVPNGFLRFRPISKNDLPMYMDNATPLLESMLKGTKI